MSDFSQPQRPGAAQRATQLAQRASARPKPGDATGREKTRLQAENAERLRERAEELTMISQVEEDQQNTGVFDPKTGEMVEKLTPEQADAFAAAEAPVGEVVEVVPAQQVQSPTVMVTMLDDVEQMTYGAGNTFPLLRAGYRYRLPRDVAEHLDARGLVRKVG